MVSTTERTLLTAVQRVLEHSDSAYLAVAFVAEAGVHLIKPQLKQLTDDGRVRMLVSTTFGTTSPTALKDAVDMGTELKILNPSGGTYHPKLYIGRRNGHATAVVGSANLTGGLISNIEVGMFLAGYIHDKPLADLWDWAEALWERKDTGVWQPPKDIEAREPVFNPALLSQIKAEVQKNNEFRTLGSSPKPNWITQVTESAIYVETERTREGGTGPQAVPAWMFELAFETLEARGELSNSELLNELRVHRSSAVCAILSRLPRVSVASRNPIKLEYNR